MAAHTFPWMQGHALLPLPVCAVTGEVLPMDISPLVMGWVLSPMADSDVGALCTGRAWGWSHSRKLFMPAFKHRSVFWRTGLTSSAMQLPAVCVLLHQGLTCSPTRKVTPAYRSGHFLLWLTEHLTLSATLVSLSTTTWLVIIPYENALFLYLLFLLRGWIYVWINPAAYFFGGFWPVLWCSSLPFFCL